MDAIVYDKVGKEAEKVREALYGIYPQETITEAAIASFDDGADGIPVKALTVGIEPVQDLHGFENPWPGGGSANQWDEEWLNGRYDSSTGIFVANSAYFCSKNRIQVVPGNTYYILAGSMTNVIFWYYDGAGNYLSQTNVSTGNWTAPNDVSYIQFSVPTSYGATYNNDIAINYPATATTYSPYSNICPISGRTGLTCVRAGKNLLNITGTSRTISGLDFTINKDSDDNVISITVNGQATAAGDFTFAQFVGISGKEYMLSGSPGARSDVLLNTSHGVNVNETGGSGVSFVYPDNTDYINVRIKFNASTTANNLVFKPMIRVASDTDSTFEPFKPIMSLSVAFPSEAGESGTVYGGTLTLNPDRTGTLRITRKSFICDDANFNVQTAEISGTTWYYFRRNIENIKKPINNQVNPTWIAAEQYTTIRSTAVVGAQGKISLQTSGTLLISTGQPTDPNVRPSGRVTYELDSPVDIPITATEVSDILTTLHGTNNIWANTGNIEKLTYRADLGKYIDSHITTAVANALNA